MEPAAPVLAGRFLTTELPGNLCLHHMTQQVCFWAFFTEKSGHVFTQKLYVNDCNVHSSFVQNKLSQTGNNPDVFQLGEWLNKLCSVYGILTNNKEQNKNEKITTSMKNNKEQTCNNLDVSPEIYTEWKKPIPKGCTLCDFTCHS